MNPFELLISAIAPPDCLGCGQEGKIVCGMCLTSEILPFGARCWRCNSLSAGAKTCSACRSFGGPLYVWITSEYHGLSKQIVATYKFRQFKPTANIMADQMVTTLLHYNDDLTIARRKYVIVPIPTANTRVRQRGYDHAKLLGRKISKKSGLRYHDALLRFGAERQVGARREARLKNLKGNYVVNNISAVAGQNILLVDDVVTTGATLREAKKALRVAGARRVDALVFAKRL